MDIDQIRKDTSGCEAVIHFNNAGASLVPRQVADAIRNYTTEEEHTGGYEIAEFSFSEVDTFYEYAAQLLNCKSSNIAFTTSATDGYNKALSAIPFKEGDMVLISENDYSSNFIAFISLQKRFGIRLIKVRNVAAGEIDLQDLEEKIKQYHPRLVSVTHVPTSSGLIQPVAAIGAIIKKYDTLFILDACQSLGQIPVDAMETGADFISGTFRKFLRGPRGTGLLYVSDRVLSSGMEPLFLDLRGAEWVAEDQYVPREDAKRFETWEKSYALMMGSIAALKYVLDLGIADIASRSSTLIARLKLALSAIDFVTLQDRGTNQCNIVTFSVKQGKEQDVKAFFRSHGINIYTTGKSSAMIDFTEKGLDWVVRVSPHYYNTESEIDRFIEVVKDLERQS